MLVFIGTCGCSVFFVFAVIPSRLTQGCVERGLYFSWTTTEARGIRQQLLCFERWTRRNIVQLGGKSKSLPVECVGHSVAMLDASELGSLCGRRAVEGCSRGQDTNMSRNEIFSKFGFVLSPFTTSKLEWRLPVILFDARGSDTHKCLWADT